MAISAISGISAAAPASPATGSSSAREAELEKEIAAKLSLARCTDCEETATKANKEAENLRGQLAALKAKDTQHARSLPTPDVPGAAALAAAANSEPSEPTDPANSDAPSLAGGDYRPLAARASAAVQSALVDLNLAST
jgi:hypothetical protein